MAERRTHQRFDFRDKCLIRHSAVVGSVIDLSLGGLSCSCSSADDIDSSECNKVDLFCSEKRLWVRDLPMKIVESERIPGKFLDNFSVRRCRARFDNLPQEKATQLENLIIAHAIS